MPSRSNLLKEHPFTIFMYSLHFVTIARNSSQYFLLPESTSSSLTNSQSSLLEIFFQFPTMQLQSLPLLMSCSLQFNLNFSLVVNSRFLLYVGTLLTSCFAVYVWKISLVSILPNADFSSSYTLALLLLFIHSHTEFVPVSCNI